ncbi:hypothetical protein kochi14H1_0030 [Enterococcus phage phi EF14H1]|nr:terminase small subunit [Enterococcus phage EFLK1]AZU99915.1 hypothetical protein vBEfaHEF1TV_71 [Enterococcus phage vB_EfaH_EF1TV]QBZ69678.1 hypothetical protein [Enterococcus phage vB_EfaM_Ef2.1]QBZ70090.1 hypothetical protein [Enterococcus phage vB_EfaM_Ef2.3]QPW37201.1 hypothetical protein [Enterococcus phage PBEF129]QVW27903.1 hypothetical protein [Enterococcus phage MDA2]UQT00450.1 hypothetical protein FGBNBECL_00099 [Enterococcus phage vB_OCPT_Bob]USL84282.1 hypothetical protein Sw
MGMADRLKDNAKQKKLERTPEQQLRDTFNQASIKLINQFMANVTSGAIEVDDIADLTRLFQIYLQVNNINDGMQEGTGTLPALTSEHKDIISEKVSTEKIIKDGEEEELISLDELASLPDDQLEEVLVNRELQMNRENEATF